MLATPVRGADDGEAWYLWLTHDNAPMVGAMGDIFRAMRANASDMIVQLRESTPAPIFILYPALLDVWRMVGGANIIIARWLSSLITLLALAITLRVAHRLKLEGKWGDVIFVGLLFAYASATVGAESLITLWSAIIIWSLIDYRKTHQLRFIILMIICVGFIILSAPIWRVNMVISLFIPLLALITLKLTHLKPDDTIHIAYNPILATTAIFLVCSFIGYQFLAIWVRQDWRDIIRMSTIDRSPTHPIVLIYPPDHPLAYYDRTEATRFAKGAVINIGWREFSEEELIQVTEALKPSSDIWIIAFNGDRQAELIAQQLGEYNRYFIGNLAGIMPQRLSTR